MESHSRRSVSSRHSRKSVKGAEENDEQHQQQPASLSNHKPDPTAPVEDDIQSSVASRARVMNWLANAIDDDETTAAGESDI